MMQDLASVSYESNEPALYEREDACLEVHGRPVAAGLDPPEGKEETKAAALPEHEKDDRLPSQER